MTQCNTINVKLCNSQLNKLKSKIKNDTEGTLNLPSKVIDDSNDETNFLHEIITNRQKTFKALQSFCE